jgi:hypothetical protein
VEPVPTIEGTGFFFNRHFQLANLELTEVKALSIGYSDELSINESVISFIGGHCAI